MLTATAALEVVRRCGGDELIERLEHLEASRGRRVDEGAGTTAPDRGASVDYDVALVGGGLSLLVAPALLRRGLRVAVFDRATIGLTHREWNASGLELDALVRGGALEEGELESLIVARYQDGFCRWHGGGTYRVRDVLDHAVDAKELLARVRRRSAALGATLYDHHSCTGVASGEGGVAMRFESRGAVREISARVMLDARGAASPSATADLLCPTVGGVLEGLSVGDAPDQMDPRVGEILVTTEGVEDRRQHIWEAFPGAPGETTVYSFYYDRAERVGPGSLIALYARFFERLPGYKRGDARLTRPTFGYIPGWSRLTPAPRPPLARVALMGDAAGRHSPLTYCGFGAMLRSFDGVAERVARSLADGTEASLGSLVHDTPLHAGTGALAHMIASPPSDPAAAGELNALLDAAFSTLHQMGDAAFGALLRDEMQARDFVRFLYATSSKHPKVYRDVFRVLGALGVSRWGSRHRAGPLELCAVTPARTHRGFRRWFAGTVVKRMTGAFESVRAEGLDHLRGALREGPVVIVSNHVTWWDPMMVLLLTERVVPCESYAMMDGANLARLPFLGLIGGFGIDLTQPADGAAAIRYAAKLLSAPGRAVWIFPQGRERPQWERPLGFRRGSAEIARVAKARTIPVALHYEFMGSERPHALISVGAPIEPTRDVEAGRDLHERAVTEGLERIRGAITADRLGDYEVLLRGRALALGALAERVLAWATRPRARRIDATTPP